MSVDFLPPAGGNCRECGKPVECGWTCEACFSADERRQRLVRVRDRVGALTRSLPPWPWARVSDPRFVERVRVERYRAFAAKFAPQHGNVVLSGASGAGKTAAMCAAAARLSSAAIDAADERAPICRSLWTDAHALVRATREHRLGAGTCPELLAATRASVLWLDELGQEPRTEALWEIVDERYEHGLVTVVTTGLRVDELRQRYGEALLRRLTERGTVIEGWPCA